MEDNEEETVNYREEILRLIAEGKIKHTTKYVEKAFDETLEKIYKSYVAKQLDETNELDREHSHRTNVRTFSVFGNDRRKREIKRRTEKQRNF